jgi:hypothetical protein
MICTRLPSQILSFGVSAKPKAKRYFWKFMQEFAEVT